MDLKKKKKKNTIARRVVAVPRLCCAVRVRCSSSLLFSLCVCVCVPFRSVPLRSCVRACFCLFCFCSLLFTVLLVRLFVYLFFFCFCFCFFSPGVREREDAVGLSLPRREVYHDHRPIPQAEGHAGEWKCAVWCVWGAVFVRFFCFCFTYVIVSVFFFFFVSFCYCLVFVCLT